MRILIGTCLIYLMISCGNTKEKDQLNESYDPFLSEIRNHSEIVVTAKNCFSWIDSCYNRIYKFKFGKLVEFNAGNIYDPIEVKYDSLLNVPIYIRPNRIVPEPIYRTKVTKRNATIILHWYEDHFPDLLDSTRYVFNKSGKVVLIENKIDFLSSSFIFKFINGFNNFALNDSLIYSKNKLYRKITKLSIRNGRKDIYGVVPLVSVTNYTYDSDNKLTKIFTVHKFKDSSQNYNCEIFFENGLPKYKIENNIRQEYYIKSF